MVQTTYDMTYFAKWLYSQDEWWLAADGRWLKITEMEKEHLLNAVLFLERAALDVHFARFGDYDTQQQEATDWLLSTQLYKSMREQVLLHMYAGDAYEEEVLEEQVDDITNEQLQNFQEFLQELEDLAP